MELEPKDDFERELQQAFARRPAPPSLKRRLMERRRTEKQRLAQAQRPFLTWQRLAASLLLTAVLAGSVEWRIVEQRRREEAARDQVLTALRITTHALDRMNTRLAAHRRAPQD
ncbi:MAG TPA: hypothetical protein VN776_09075 [Terracidiphilus sp.]|nr:hypothetical protein [Terracidiphilus sp.]